MKKALFLFLLIAACCTLPQAFAQSRRITQPAEGEKANRRPAATPTPENIAGEEGAADDGVVVSVDTELVTVPVRVLDRKNRFIGGLKAENFKVFEDGVEQEIAYFSNEAQPFTVALVLDMSYSTTFKISEIQLAAIQFIDQLRANDKVMVISFDQEVHVLTEPTSDRSQIYKAINSTKITTGTSLYDTVNLVINHKFKKVEGRKAMVLFTDGVDTSSETSHDLENLRDVMESETLIYPIRYDTFADVQRMKNAPPTAGLPGSLPQSTPPTMPTRDPSGLPFPLPTMGGSIGGKGTSREEYAHAENYLNQLADRTGGRIYLASSFGNLTDAFGKIASELREFYSIGYTPKLEPQPGQVRALKVRTDQPNVAVKARANYVVPGKTPKRKR